MAYESNIREELKTLIIDNKDDLVLNLTEQGVPKQVRQVATSIVTPPTEFLFVRISVDNTSFTNRLVGSKNINTLTNINHSVRIELGDYVYLSSLDAEPYETNDRNFQIFGDNVIDLLLSSTFTNFKIDKTNEVIISKDNQSSNSLEDGVSNIFFYSTIQFEVIQC